LWSHCARYWGSRALLLLAVVLLPLPALAQGGDIPWDLIPPEFIQEAIEVEAECAGNPFVAAHYDCPCLAARFFGERIAQGPDADRNGVLMAVQDACPNVPGRAGWAYARCIGRPTLTPPGWRGDADGYCACYANAYARLFRGTPSARVSVRIDSQARVACMNRPAP
jgi:hypothetical protein